MHTKLSRWGNSLAVRIPQHVAREAGLVEGTEVELTALPGGLAVRPVAAEVPPLEALLAGITDENRHDAVDTGPPVGAELW